MIPIARPSLGKEELRAVEKVFETRWLGMGSFVYEFEKKIQSYVGVKYAIATNTGTTAIHLALAASGIGCGDEVIVPSLTFAGTVQPIISVGAKPVFCDVEPGTLNIDCVDARNRLTGKTKAIIPVHYGGTACDMDALLGISRKRKLLIIEDAAHAFGSSYKAKMIGSFGHMAAFSFDPIKSLTCGEGGAVVTNSARLAEDLRRKRLLGITKDTWLRYKNKRSWFYEVVTSGYRYHMSNINAAIGLVQFGKLGKFIKRKRDVIKQYDDAFRYIPGIILLDRNYAEMSPFNYTIRLKKDRNTFIQYMERRGISVGVNYIPNHIQPFFKKFKTRLPVTEKVWNQIVSLPLYYDISQAEIDKVVRAVLDFMEGKR